MIVGAKEGRVTHHTLNKLYHHELGIEGKHFTAYNMTAGGFGGVRGRDMFIVQSMDGKVQILEQSANAFSRQLIDCLIPGPIAYVPKLDSFVTVNHAGQAECYRYQVLASSQTDLGSKDTGNDAKSRLNTGSFGITTVRSALVEWKVDLGEPCRQIIEGCFSTATVDYNRTVSELIFVCDKSLFLIKAESGGVIQQKRLERSDASCICPYPVATNSGAKSTNFLLASQDSTIQVYSAFNLVWAAKTTSVPVQMAVTSFGSQKGLVTSIDDSGLLSISYLGTRPPVNAVTSHVREMDYEKIDEEHRSLLQIIRESQNENKVEPTERLLMRSQLPKTLDMDHMDVALPKNLVPVYQTVAGMSNDHNVVKVCVRIYLTYTGDKPATDVSIAVSVPNFIHVVPKHVVMQKVAGVKSTPAMVKFYFYTIKDFAASTFDACVTASYQSSKGEPRVATHTFQLPIFLAARPKPPVTQGVSAKLTLDTEYPAQPLTDLFDDFLYAAQESGIELTDALGNNATQAMGFQLLSSNGTEPVTVVGGNQNPVVSVLVSKNAGRYRIQSSTYTALLPIVLELERRLISKIEDLSASSGKPVKADAIVTGMKGLVTCADPLPVEEYFQVISSHHKTRKTIALLNSQLNDYAHQFRLVQKRLLVRFKDRNPTPLAGLDFLLNETYKKLVEIGK